MVADINKTWLNWRGQVVAEAKFTPVSWLQISELYFPELSNENVPSAMFPTFNMPLAQ